MSPEVVSTSIASDEPSGTVPSGTSEQMKSAGSTARHICVQHSVRRVQNLARRVQHSARRVQHSVRRVQHSVRRVQHSVRRVQHSVRLYTSTGTHPSTGHVHRHTLVMVTFIGTGTRICIQHSVLCVQHSVRFRGCIVCVIIRVVICVVIVDVEWTARYTCVQHSLRCVRHSVIF